MNRILSTPSDTTIDKVKCSLCGNYLSHFPIFVTEEEEDVCGRCSILEGKSAFHNIAFEKIAQHIKFPCQFRGQGCVKELLPKDVPSHEENCHFKIVACPGKSFTCCSWEGTRNSILSHCQETHKDLFLKEQSFELDLNVSSSNYYVQKFLEYDGTLFIISMIHDLISKHPKTVSFMIYHIKEEVMNLENHSYKIALTKGKTNIIVESATSNFFERDWCKVALDSLMMDAKHEESLIVGNIILGTSVDGVLYETRKGFNEAFLSFLTCDQRENYVLPPDQCLCDTIIRCGYCLVDSCICIISTDLNKIADMLDYPCLYKNNGCNVVLKGEKMRNHRKVCLFEKKVCHFCSTEVLSKDLKKHVLDTHSDIIIENGQTISIANEKSTVRRLIHYENHIFLSEFFIEKGSEGIVYEWIVALLGKSQNEFQYEIELSNTKRNIRILRVKKCFPLDYGLFYTLEDNNSKFLQTEINITFKVTII